MSHFTTTPRRARHSVFVSYSRKDGEAFAIDLRKRITDRGIQVWQDLTHMEGGRDWWEQIKDALNQVEFMVLVMTPSAVHSEVVRKEWRYARQQGVCIYPVKADARIDIQSLPRWMSRVHWYDLGTNEQQSRFFNDLTVLCATPRVPFMAEPLPADFIPREAEFAELKQQLLSHDQQEPVAITAAFRGAGGYGKTTLARALCHDEDIQFAFDDGILWVTLGEKPTDSVLLGKLRDLIRIISGEHPTFETLDAGKSYLNELLDNRDILLVIDDVWRSGDLMPFLGSGSRCARLITTRRVDVLPSEVLLVSIEQMAGAEAIALLGHGLPDKNMNETKLQSIANQIGRWPLLLKLANSWLSKRTNRSKQPLDQALISFQCLLTENGITAFDAHNATERNEAVARTLELSFSCLAQADQIRLLELAVFEEDAEIPLSALNIYWKANGRLDNIGVEETCQRLFDESLLVDFRLDQRFVRLHDAIRSWLISRPSHLPLTERHKQLLTAYNPDNLKWHEIEDDGYLHIHLPRHLKEAGLHGELHTLLLDLDWMYRRLTCQSKHHQEISDISGLIAAYDTEREENAFISEVQSALKQSSHVLARQPKHIGVQLYGRLGPFHIKKHPAWIEKSRTWGDINIRPTHPALISPGPLRMTRKLGNNLIHGMEIINADNHQILYWSNDHVLHLWDFEQEKSLAKFSGHTSYIKGVKYLSKSNQILSWSADKTLRLWDLEREKSVIFSGHDGEVISALINKEQQQLISWSSDRTMRLWELQSGKQLGLFKVEQAGISNAKFIANGHRLLSWSFKTLHLWDLQEKRALGNFTGHTGSITDVIILDKHDQVLSWADDNSLRLWDLKKQQLVAELTGHQGAIVGAELVNEDHVLTWSKDYTLRLWDLPGRKTIAELTGHQGSIIGAKLLTNNKAISWSSDNTLRIWNLKQKTLISKISWNTRNISGIEILPGSDKAIIWSWAYIGNIYLLDFSKNSITKILGHGNSVCGVKTIGHQQALSWSRSGNLHVWDFRHEQAPTELSTHSGKIERIMLLDCHQRALSYSADNTICLWELQDGAQLHIMSGQETKIRDIIQFDNGSQALSLSYKKLHLWDLKTGKTSGILDGHVKRVGGIAMLDKTRVISWSDDGNIIIWDLYKKNELANITANNGYPISSIKITSDGQQIYSWSSGEEGDQSLCLWDIKSQKIVSRIFTQHGHSGNTIDFLPIKNQQVMTWDNYHSLCVRDLKNGNTAHIFDEKITYGAPYTAERGMVRLATFNDDREALSWSTNGFLILWNINNTQEKPIILQNHDSNHPIHRVHIIDNGARAISMGSRYIIWDLVQRRMQETLSIDTGSIIGMHMLDDGRRALLGSDNGNIYLWDLSSGKKIATFVGHEAKTNRIRLFNNGKNFLSTSEDRTLRIWNLERYQCMGTHFLDFTPTDVAIGMNGHRIIAGDAGGRIHVLDITSV